MIRLYLALIAAWLLGSMTPAIKFYDYSPRGSAREIFSRRNDEIVLSGPAGTGKSRACLEKVHAALEKYPAARALMVRQTRSSLTKTGIVTYTERVLPEGAARFDSTVQEFLYPNGSKLGVAGLDKPSKIMSSEYDLIYVQEATELQLNGWESLTTRLRNGRLPYQQMLADCNPDGPRHWLRERANSGKTLMLESRHEDNPALWDGERWTPQGAAYIAKLDALTGVRYLRLRKGIWAAAEGMVYDGWDRSKHIVARDIPQDWPRYWSIDFGYVNPFVWQSWAEDPDGRLWLCREIYQTKRLVEDLARQILATEKIRPRAIIVDHDAEDRATLERYLGMPTLAAYKFVSPGIQAVQRRLRPWGGTATPGLVITSDALVERDEDLAESHKPTRTAEEIEGYVWDRGAGRKEGDTPLKRDDHGCDAMRYMVAFVDNLAIEQGEIEAIVTYEDHVSISPF